MGSLSSRVQPQLLAGDLLMRPWVVADAPALVRAYDDPDIYRWHCRSFSLADAEAWVEHNAHRWQQDAGAGWAVIQGDVVVGRVGLGSVHLDEGRAGLAYWVVRDARGRGVAPLALGAVVDWAFDEVGFHRLELDHSTQNEASCRVAVKAGFALEGTKRRQALHLDGWHDMHAHALLADDPRPGRPVASA